MKSSHVSYVFSLLLLGLTPGASAQPQTVLDTDFATAYQPVQIPGATSSQQIAGVLPEGWHDDSTWNTSIRVTYQNLSDGKRRFLRITNRVGGRAQITHPLPAVTQRDVYDLTLTARSLTHAGIEAGVRDVGTPYAFPLHATATLTPRWHDYHFRLVMDPQSQPVGFWVTLEAGSPVSEIDLAHIRLLRLTRDDLIQEIKTRFPNPGSGNLARVSRFPLGLQSGWSADNSEATADPSVVGPSGAPTLRVHSIGVERVTAAPLAVRWSFEPHVLSLSLRGTAQGRVIVRGERREIAQTPFTLSGDGWQRIVVPFTPDLMGKSHDFEIESSGTLWVDAVQLERGTKAHDFTPPMPVEVSLACPSSDASLARIQFDDETPVINFALLGTRPGAVLKSRAVTVYGQAASLPDIKLGPDSRKGRLRYDVFPQRPFGPFRVEAWVEDAQGRPLSGISEIVVSRLHRPRAWGRDAPASPFGVHLNNNEHQRIMAKAIGANWVRLHDAGTQFIGWSFLEPEKGQWHYFDAELQSYRRNHLKILGMISTAPGWATSLGKPAVGYWDRYVQPLDIPGAWRQYVENITQRYRGLIDSYEIWNEPWGDYWGVWDSQKNHSVKTPESFAAFSLLQKTAYDSAHAKAPGVTIAGFNSNGGDIGTRWTQGLRDAGGLQSCDVFSYHQYTNALTGFPADAVRDDLRAATGPVLDSRGRMPKPVWLSEGNAVNGQLDTGLYRYTVPDHAPDDNIALANRLSRFVVSLLAHGDRKVFLYSMAATGQLGTGDGDWRSLICADGSLHPCGAAYANLTWYLEGLNYQKTQTLTPGVYAFVFSAPGRAVAVVSTAPGHAAYTLPAGTAQVSDLFGNLLTGRTSVGDTLLYVSGRDAAGLERRLH